MLYYHIKKCFPFFVLLVLTACKTSFQVQTENFNTVKFPEERSFKFFNPKNLPKSNFSFSEENQKILFDAVATEFKEMGYSSRQDAALLVKIQGGTVVERELKERYPYYGNYYSYNRYPTFNDYYMDISKKRTTVIIDVLDAETNKILWQGVGSGEMGRRVEEVEPKLREAIEQILAEFPMNTRDDKK